MKEGPSQWRPKNAIENTAKGQTSKPLVDDADDAGVCDDDKDDDDDAVNHTWKGVLCSATQRTGMLRSTTRLGRINYI